MSNNYYKIYIDSTLKLAQTLVIKSQDTVDLQNQWITQYYGSSAVNPLDPTTWKYYMNMAGEYHPTDTLMHVVSLDTLETILFNKDNLKIHRATARAYAYGTRNYRELLTLYPNQENLIFGIIQPVDKQAAIDAEDGDILSWPADLVEPNEYSLISKIETWVKAYRLQWENRQFAISDDLYLPVSYAVMYLNMVPAILNFRLDACKTIEAHSYHVREYLASHNGLDQYVDFLTLEQRLYLYRNIRYIQRNAGSQEQFDLLIDKFMTARLMPVGDYTARHILTDMPVNSLTPHVMVRKKPLNLGVNSTTYDLVELDDFYKKERYLARDNATYETEYLDQARYDLTVSKSSVVTTKAVESSVVDYSDSSPYKLTDTLLMNWLHQSNIGLYQAVVSCANPKTGERYSLRANEAFTFLWYLYHQSMGINPPKMLPIMATRVMRDKLITVDDMLTVVSSKWRTYLRPYLEQAREMLPVLTRSISIDAFYNQTYLIYQAINKQRILIAQEHHQEVRAQFFNAVDVLYMDKVYEPSDPTESYGTWLAERNIFIDGLTRDQYEMMYLELFNEGTGLSINTATSIRDVQQALIKLITAMSSYSIQFMSTMNASTITTLDWAAQRIGDDRTYGSSHYEVPAHGINIVERNDYLKSSVQLDPERDAAEPLVDFKLFDKFDLELGATMNKDRSLFKQRFEINTAISVKTPLPTIPYENGVVNVSGMDYFEQLSYDERFRIKDYWMNRPAAQ